MVLCPREEFDYYHPLAPAAVRAPDSSHRPARRRFFIAAGFGFVSPARTPKTNGSPTGRRATLAPHNSRTADDSVRSPVIPNGSSRPRTANTNPSSPCPRDWKVLECCPSDSEGCSSGAMEIEGRIVRVDSRKRLRQGPAGPSTNQAKARLSSQKGSVRAQLERTSNA